MAPPPPKAKWDEEEEESSEEETSEEESEEEAPKTTRAPVKAPVKAPAPAPVVSAPARRKFDDEEDSDDVAENWDEEDDSEAEAEKAKAAAAAAAAKAKADAEAAKNKKSKSQRLEEHREAARRRRAAEDIAESEEEETEAERRSRLLKQEKDADLQNASDLLSNVGLGPKARKDVSRGTIVEDPSLPGGALDLATLSLFKPNTKTQFDNLSSALIPLITPNTQKAHYSLWMQGFVKAIAGEMPSGEIKKVASVLTALSNERMKEEKLAEKGGKKSKAAKAKVSLAGARDVGRGLADTTAYGGDDGLGDDDFM